MHCEQITPLNLTDLDLINAYSLTIISNDYLDYINIRSLHYKDTSGCKY